MVSFQPCSFCGGSAPSRESTWNWTPDVEGMDHAAHHILRIADFPDDCFIQVLFDVDPIHVELAAVDVDHEGHAAQGEPLDSRTIRHQFRNLIQSLRKGRLCVRLLRDIQGKGPLRFRPSVSHGVSFSVSAQVHDDFRPFSRCQGHGCQRNGLLKEPAAAGNLVELRANFSNPNV